MSKLTNDQFEKLTPEQQDTLGIVEKRRVRRRQALLKHARPSTWRRSLEILVPLVVFAGACVLGTLLDAGKPSSLSLLSILIMPLFMLIYFPTDSLHRRLDALMELLDDDLKSEIKKEDSDDDHAT